MGAAAGDKELIQRETAEHVRLRAAVAVGAAENEEDGDVARQRVWAAAFHSICPQYMHACTCPCICVTGPGSDVLTSQD